MASVRLDPKSGKYRIMFWFGGRLFQKSLKTKEEKKADSLKGQIENTLRAIEEGWLNVPVNADFWTFVFSGGKLETKATAPEIVTLKELFDRYEEQMSHGAIEKNSLATCKGHRKHLLRILGSSTHAQVVTVTEMQGYVNQRSKEKHQDDPIKSRTIKKEVATFRVVWNWAKPHGLVTGDSPTKGLRYAKEEQKPEFQTWEQIERQIARGGLTRKQIDELWDCLFLTPEQIQECLNHVKSAAAFPFIYPAIVFVAHTGARRSEMRRSRIEDFDFEENQVGIREKKRDREVKETKRFVQMSPMLARVMKEWLAAHPGGPFTFCHGDVVRRSRKRSRTTGHKSGHDRGTTLKERLATVCERVERLGPKPLSKKEAHCHFKKTLADSKWKVLKGWHVFRHSLASNLAAADMRQEVIDKMLGHVTEEMRRRYRHLLPKEKIDALQKVFGE